MKAQLVAGWNHDHSLVIGQGTRAAPFQAIMSKPPNVRYAYPLRSDRSEVILPE